MPASLVTTAKVGAGGLALAVLLCWAPGSQAAVFTGSATDAPDDLSPAGANALPDPPTNFTHVAVKYDDVAGRVDVAYTFDQVPASYQEIDAGVGLGKTRADGSCSAPFFSSLSWHILAGEAAHSESAVEGHSATGDVTGILFSVDGEATWTSTSLFEWPGARTWNFATTNDALVDRPYNCATAGMSLTDMPTPADAGPGEDSLEGNAFALTPDAPLVNTPPATEPAPGTNVPPNASSGSQRGVPRFTSTKARRAVKRALANRYGKAFSEREDYTAACVKKSSSRWSCAVQWDYGQFVYKGKVRLTMRSDGRLVTRLSLRRTK